MLAHPAVFDKTKAKNRNKLHMKQNGGFLAFRKCLGYYQFQHGIGFYNGLKYSKIKINTLYMVASIL